MRYNSSMKHIAILLFIFVLFGCIRKADNSQLNNSEANESELNITMYVNSIDGVIVDYSPTLYGATRAILSDLTEVIVKREEENDFGKWFFIEWGDTGEGWVPQDYLSLTKPERKELLINSIANHIYTNDFYRFEKKHEGNNLDEYLSSFDISEYEILEQETYEANFHGGGIVTTYIIQAGKYKFFLYGTFLISVEIELDKDNFLHLFPHTTIEEYLADDSFGLSKKYGDDSITYPVPTNWDKTLFDNWTLHFKDGKLFSIQFDRYLT